MKQTQAYRAQVELLLQILPEVSKEKCFALFGGTAINLFVQNMPRLSVDIDLLYIPIESRSQTLENISSSLKQIKNNIEKKYQDIKVKHHKDMAKLLVSLHGASIKVEVNLVQRGLLDKSTVLALSDKVQEDFDMFCEMTVVSIGQLYGGKICAALDRQHPRDFFDVKQLFTGVGIDRSIKEGFLLNLISTVRPAYELLNPNLLDQRSTLENQFARMSFEAFSYADFEKTREELINQVNALLTYSDKEFLLSGYSLSPKWELYDFSKYPSVMWKIHNLTQLKDTNHRKFKDVYNTLEKTLAS